MCLEIPGVNIPAVGAKVNEPGFTPKPEEGSFYANGRERRAAAREQFEAKPEVNDLPVPASTDRFVRQRDGNRCQGCGLAIGEKRADGSKVREMHVDHINPRRRNGRNNEENLRCACDRCNLGKGGKAPEQWEKPIVDPAEPPPPKPEVKAEDKALLQEKSAHLHDELASKPKRT